MRITFLSTVLSMIAATSFAQNLQPQSQQEFQRVYGASGAPVQRAPAQTVVPNQGLSQQSLDEFRRVLGQEGQGSIAGSAALQKLTTPNSIDSTVLSEMLKNQNDPLRFLILWHSIAVDVTAIDYRAVLTASPSTYH